MCGTNESSQLGWSPSHPPASLTESVKISDGIPSLSTPTRVASLDAFSVHHVAMGLSHVVTVVADGLLGTFGGNEFGQLGKFFLDAR